jgi:hypothetical protein
MDRSFTPRGFRRSKKLAALIKGLKQHRWFAFGAGSLIRTPAVTYEPVFIVVSCLFAFSVAQTSAAGDILRGGIGSNGSTSPAVTTYYGRNAAAISQLDQNAHDILARTTNALQAAQFMQ